MPYNPDQYWTVRGGPDYMASIAVPEYREHEKAQEEFLREKVLSRNPDRLLDFGCGTGKLFHLWQTVPYPQGYDISPTMLAEARKTLKALYGEHVRDWQFPLHTCGFSRTKLPYTECSFDAVVACEVLAHVLPDEIEATVKALARILVPDGILAIVTAAPFQNGAAHNFNYDYEKILLPHFVIEYDELREPYRHILAVRRNGDAK